MSVIDDLPRRRPFFALAGLGFASVLAVILLTAQIFAAPGEVTLVNPLAPPDTRSPQATLMSFQREVAAAADLITIAFEHHVHSADFFSSEETRNATATAKAHLARAMRCLDLSGIPPASRDKIGTERVLMLAEVLKRVPQVDVTAPVAADVTQWTIPNTEIRIARGSGTRAGEYLFTAETVERIPEFYSAVRAPPATTRSISTNSIRCRPAI